MPLLVLQMNRHVGSGAADADHGFAERWRGQGHAGIVGEAEAFFGNADEVAVELGVAVLIVNGGDGIITWRQVRPHRCRSAADHINGRGTAAEGFRNILRPTIGCREDDRAQIALGVAEAIDVNAQGTAGTSGLVAATLRVRAPTRRCKEQHRRKD